MHRIFVGYRSKTITTQIASFDDGIYALTKNRQYIILDEISGNVDDVPMDIECYYETASRPIAISPVFEPLNNSEDNQ